MALAQLIAEYSQLPGKSLLEAAGPRGRGQEPLRLSGRLTSKTRLVYFLTIILYPIS